MDTLIIGAIVAGYVVQWGAALVVVLNHAQDKAKPRPSSFPSPACGKGSTADSASQTRVNRLAA